MSGVKRESDRELLSSDNLRLRLRVEELGTALRQKQEQTLEMLGRLQEREEQAVRRAIEELSRSEERFRLLIESVEDYAIFFLDRRGNITTWNPGAARILGYEESEVIRQPFTIFREAESAVPADFVLTEAAAANRVESEGWRKRKDGNLLWMNEIVTALRGARGELLGFVDIMRDLTAQNRYQRMLEDTATELEQTVENLELRTEEAERARAAAEAAERRAALLAEVGRAGSASLDPASMLNGVVQLLVPEFADACVVFLTSEMGQLQEVAAARIPNEADGDKVSLQTVLGVHRTPEDPIHRVFRTGEPELFKVRSSSATGSLIREPTASDASACAIAAALVARKEVLGVICCLREAEHPPFDTHDVVFAEALARRVGVAVDNARLYEAAVLANRAKSEFLAVMSHELRTPLNAVMGYSDLLAAGVDGELSERQQQHLERIKQSAHHLLGIIQEILSYARMESGRTHLIPEDVDAVELARGVSGLAHPLAAEKGLQLRVVLPNTPVRMTTDAGKLRQILINLLSNAIKFTDIGSVTLQLKTDTEHATFSVTDTGIGIPARYHQKIFEPFWQIEQGTTRNTGGTGLGLSVSRKLAQLMGGELSVRSEPGKGSTFTLTLPYQIPEN